MFSIIILFCAVIGYWLYHELIAKRKNYPPGPMPLPFMGNIHQLTGDIANWTSTISAWGKEYGGVVTVWIPEPCVMVTDYKLMKNSFAGQYNEALAGRANNHVIDSMFAGKYGIFNSEGNVWREQRRFTLHVLRDFGFGRNVMEAKIWEDIDRMLEHIDAQRVKVNGKLQATFDPEMTVTICIASIISGITFGETYEFEGDKKFERMMAVNRKSFDMLARPDLMMLGQFNFLKYVPYNGGFGHQELEQLQSDFVKLFPESIQQHREQLAANPDLEPEDFVMAYLIEQRRRKENGQDLGTFTDWQLYTNVFDLWSAGMETTATTLRWAMVYSCIHPQYQDRLRDELNDVVGDVRCTMSDRLRLPFLNAFLTETMRLANILPINGQHTAKQNIEIGGHRIIQGTMVMPQISAIMHDPVYFDDPLRFNPDRFLSEVDGSISVLTAETEKVIAFGLGKRQCLGEALARQELMLIFATLIQKYRLSLPGGDLREPKDVHYLTRCPSSHQVVFESI